MIAKIENTFLQTTLLALLTLLLSLLQAKSTVNSNAVCNSLFCVPLRVCGQFCIEFLHAAHPEWYAEKGVTNGVAVYRGLGLKQAE